MSKHVSHEVSESCLLLAVVAVVKACEGLPGLLACLAVVVVVKACEAGLLACLLACLLRGGGSGEGL